MRLIQPLQSVNQRRWRQLSPLSESWRRELPFGPGVYVFYGRSNDVLYVGKSKSLRNRVSSYFQSRADLIPKIRIFVPQISKIKVSETKTEFEALLVEARLIRELGPKYNSRLTDDRSPLYIAVTDEMFPRVLTARKTDLGGIEAREIYGPFLSGETVRRVLKIARRMFPYCNHNRSVSNQFKKARPFLKRPGLFGIVRYRRVCFYRHLGLCPGVCSGEISRRRYLSIIRKLEQFLSGDFAGLKGNLEKEMNLASKRKDYERAAGARDAAEALGSLALAGEYEEETTVTARERVETVIKLLSRLGIGKTVKQWSSKTVDSKTVNQYTGLPAYRSTDYRSTVSRFHRDTEASFRIEGFDVSNLGGRLATAAMVVFVGGIKEIGEYRHFKIGRQGRPRSPRLQAPGAPATGGQVGYARDDAPDDPRMIAEAVERRLLHPEWGKPDLVLIDGGEPQIRRIRSLERSDPFGEDILYLGLAKNPDRLVISSGNGFKTVRVSSRDLGFQLLQQVRDEAHRFGRRLHLGLRKKAMVG